MPNQSNSHTKSNWIVKGMVYAAGTTNFPRVGATNLDSYNGVVRAANYITSDSYIVATTYVRGTTGIYFQQGNAKLFAQGTYIGTGGATAAITASGLTTIHGVSMSPWTKGYASATTLARNAPRPAIANGTVGSFYPLIYRTAATNKNVQLGTGNAATWKWFAWGA